MTFKILVRILKILLLLVINVKRKKKVVKELIYLEPYNSLVTALLNHNSYVIKFKVHLGNSQHSHRILYPLPQSSCRIFSRLRLLPKPHAH